MNPENDFIKKSLRTKEANQLEIKANDARVREASLSWPVLHVQREFFYF